MALKADLVLSYNALSAYHSSTESVAPYLRPIVRNSRSRTRMPAASRPRHVVFIGACLLLLIVQSRFLPGSQTERSTKDPC